MSGRLAEAKRSEKSVGCVTSSFTPVASSYAFTNGVSSHDETTATLAFSLAANDSVRLSPAIGYVSLKLFASASSEGAEL